MSYVLMFLCSYVLMFLCSYVLMFLCSYVLMFLSLVKVVLIRLYIYLSINKAKHYGIMRVRIRSVVFMIWASLKEVFIHFLEINSFMKLRTEMLKKKHINFNLKLMINIGEIFKLSSQVII